MSKKIQLLEYIKSQAQSYSTEDMLMATIEFLAEHVKAEVEISDEE